MTIIIHPVGDGDLGVDILSLSGEEKRRRRDESRKRLGELIDAGCAEAVADALLTTRPLISDLRTPDPGPRLPDPVGKAHCCVRAGPRAASAVCPTK